MVSDADDLGEIVIRVHGPSFAEDTAVFEKTLILGDRLDVILSKTFRVVANIDVSLDPGIDIHVSGGTSEDIFIIDDTDDSRNVGGSHVVKNDGGIELGGDIGTPVEDGGISHDSVDDCDSTDEVNTNDLKADLCVVDGDSLDIPSPVPGHFDGSVRSIDSDVPDGKLLVSYVETNVSTVDNEVTHKATAEDHIQNLFEAILVR